MKEINTVRVLASHEEREQFADLLEVERCRDVVAIAEKFVAFVFDHHDKLRLDPLLFEWANRFFQALEPVSAEEQEP